MQLKRLGRSDLMVSELCLGSMTWGTQNTEAEGHAQIDLALEHGVNFIDTAEMYPVNPVSASTVGRTEEIIGTWVARTGRRGDVVIATKVTGAGQGVVRNGAPVTGAVIRAAVEGSLRRLQCESIDLYQLHWPNRGSYHFRQHWDFDPTKQNAAAMQDHVSDVMDALQDIVKQGKIRNFGLSNESAWGMAQWLRVADLKGGPRAISVQNEYSLLCRGFDTDLAEVCANEQVTLLAFSPLATGLLSGKYSGDVIPEQSRRSMNPTLSGRVTPRVWGAVSAYLGIAARHGLDPCQMALAWCRTRPVPTIPIFGATSPDQVRLALGSVAISLSDTVMAEIAAAYQAHPLPY